MSEHTRSFALASRDPSAPAPVLTGVQVSGRLDGVLFELTLRQTYRNTSDRNLEVVYTFPLPHQAVLLGFASELNGLRQDGVIVAKRAAEQRYEQALAAGDAPVMLEALGDGLHTANIGNLQPGDDLVLEARYAQLLRFEQGRLRIAVPTTIAPRYGNAERAGLQPQQVPSVSLDADHALALSITFGEAFADAALDCPTHRWTTTARAASGELRLDLAPDARLDRDVVVIVTPRQTQAALVTTAHDATDADAPVVVMAAFEPQAVAPRTHVAIKLLVDCSGSMGGDSIASARAAMRGLLADLGEADTLSLSRFGSTVEHLRAPAAATQRMLRLLRPLIDKMQADLGGTEMEAALRSVFALQHGRSVDADHGGAGDAGGVTGDRGAGHAGAGADVLLITDGEVWQVDDIVAAARQSGHRVFAIGVGSAPAEGLLRSLAEATGGACEFTTPGEALEAAARRMLSRMRQPARSQLRVDWGAAPVWQLRLPAGVFAGDTVLAFAGFDVAPPWSAIQMLADDEQGRGLVLARAGADAPSPGDSLARMAAAQRLGQVDDPQALALALRYQLMSRQTNCILVHQREDADKARQEPELQSIDSMFAAGWGATGTTFRMPRSASAPVAFDAMAMGDPFDAGEGFGSMFGIVAAPSITQAGAAEPLTLTAMAERVALALDTWGELGAMAAHLPAPLLHPDAQRALDKAVRLGVDIDQAWLLLALWVATRPGGLGRAEIAATVQPFVSTIEPGLAARVAQVFDRLLGSYPLDGWTLSRARRLRRALTGAA